MKTPIFFAMACATFLTVTASKSLAHEVEIPEESSHVLNSILVEADVEDTGGAYFSSRAIENVVCSGDVCTAQDGSELVTITGEDARRFFDALSPHALGALPALVCQVSYGSKAQCFAR